MKLLYFGDFHNRQKPPVSRIDDWPQTVKDKVSEIKQIAAANNVSAMLQPGDFLDSPKISDEFLYQLVALWSDLDVNQLLLKIMANEMSEQELYAELKKSKPMIGVIGNHELFGHSNKAFNKTSLSLLSQIGLMNLATKESPILLKSEDGFTVAITGANYHADIDRDPQHNDYIVDKKLGDFHIHLVHGYGTVHDFGNLMPHTKIQELGHTQADLTIMGHDHIGFDPVQVNGKWFVNPGAPIRLSNDAKEMARQPKVMLIEIGSAGLNLTMVPLTSAKDSALVLDTSKKEIKQEQQEKLDEIIDTIKKANVNKGEDIVEIVDNIAASKNISDEIKKDVRELISKKAEVLAVAKQVPTKYHIEKLELTNFQSHEHSVFEFSEGLNVFTGESRSGKTGIIRALGWIYEDYGGASRRFIKTGAKSAEATITLSNGYIISRIVEAKSNGFNGYKVFHPAKGEWETMNTKAIGVIQELLGFSHLQIDKTDTGKIETIPLNFLRQGNSWFFIGDDTTGSSRAKIIGTICGTNIADAAIREIESKNKELTLTLKNVDKEIISIDIEVGCMTHVEQLEKDIVAMETLVNEVDALMERKNFLEASRDAVLSLEAQMAKLLIIEKDLESLKEAKKVAASLVEHSRQKEAIVDIQTKVTLYAKNQQQLEHVIQALESTTEAQKVLVELKLLAEQRKAINQFITDLSAITKTGLALNKFIKGIPDVESIKNCLSGLKELHEKKTMILSHQGLLVLNEKQQQGLTQLIGDLTNVEKAKAIIADIAATIEQKKSIADIRKSTAGLDKDIATEETNITDYTKQIKSVKMDYMEVFSKVDHCPLCLHEITRDDAIAIAKNKFTKEN